MEALRTSVTNYSDGFLQTGGPGRAGDGAATEVESDVTTVGDEDLGAAFRPFFGIVQPYKGIGIDGDGD